MKGRVFSVGNSLNQEKEGKRNDTLHCAMILVQPISYFGGDVHLKAITLIQFDSIFFANIDEEFLWARMM